MVNNLTLSLGAVSIDFAAIGGCAIVDMGSNPIIPLSIPKDITNPRAGTVGINLGFVSESFHLTFTFLDGLGALNFTTPGSTNYEKFKYMASYKKNPKTLTINGATFPVQITNWNIPFEAGKGTMAMNGSCTLQYVMSLNME